MDGYQCREHGVTEPCAHCLADELACAERRIAAAVAECEDIERNWRSYDDTTGADVAERIRAKLEGR